MSHFFAPPLCLHGFFFNALLKMVKMMMKNGYFVMVQQAPDDISRQLYKTVPAQMPYLLTYLIPPQSQENSRHHDTLFVSRNKLTAVVNLVISG